MQILVHFQKNYPGPITPFTPISTPIPNTFNYWFWIWFLCNSLCSILVCYDKLKHIKTKKHWLSWHRRVRINLDCIRMTSNRTHQRINITTNYSSWYFVHRTVRKHSNVPVVRIFRGTKNGWFRIVPYDGRVIK